MVMRLEVQQLRVGFAQGPVLHQLSFALPAGQLLALLGPNGSGKSTLLRSIDRLLLPDQGTIRLDGCDVVTLSPRQIAQRIAFVPQRDEQLRPASVFDVVLLGRIPHFGLRPRAADFDVVQQVLERLELSPLAQRNVLELSGGQRQRVMIARALAQQPRLLLIDEPTANLDLKYQLQVLTLLQKEVERGRDGDGLSIIVAIHQLNLALRFAHRFLLLDSGAVVDQGPPAELKASTISKVFGVQVDRCPHGAGAWLIPR